MKQAPKYKKVYDDISRKIETGILRPGDRLPTEISLARISKVSLGTIQKSLKLLEDDGLVVRRHGSGTYVSAVLPNQSEVFNHYFVPPDSKNNRSEPLPLYIKVLDVSVVKAPGPWSARLQHTGDVIRVERIMNVNLEFQIYTEMYLPKSQFSHILQNSKHKLDGIAFFRAMYGDHQLPPRKFLYDMWLAATPARAAGQIHVAPDSVCLHWEALALSNRDAPIFYSLTYVPPTKQRLRIEVLRDITSDRLQYSASNSRSPSDN